MTEIEEKSYKTRINLFNDIVDCDNMILHTIRGHADAVLKSIVYKKSVDTEKDAVVFTVAEFNEIKTTLSNISTEEGNCKINRWVENSYISPRKIKLGIVNQL